MKDKYNTDEELILVLPYSLSPIFVKHCSICDTTDSDMFAEWLDILSSSVELDVPILGKPPYLDLKYVSKLRTQCTDCGGYTVWQTIFEWVHDDSEN